MKKTIVFTTLVATLFTTSIFAQGFSKASNKAEILQTNGKGKQCSSCKMKLPMFWKTSHAVKLKNGDYIQFCSIADMLRAQKKQKLDVVQYLAVDVTSEKLMNSSTMTYVVGSSIRGTMSSVSKLAFKVKKDALTFQKKYGGKIYDFEKTKELSLKIIEDDMKNMKMKKHHHKH